jgi:hypothetical protein
LNAFSRSWNLIEKNSAPLPVVMKSCTGDGYL